jgi:hypothetical protein
MNNLRNTSENSLKHLFSPLNNENKVFINP